MASAERSTDRWTDGRAVRDGISSSKHGQMDGRTDGQMDGRTGGAGWHQLSEAPTDGRTDGQTGSAEWHQLSEARTDGRTDGRTGGAGWHQLSLAGCEKNCVEESRTELAYTRKTIRMKTS